MRAEEIIEVVIAQVKTELNESRSVLEGELTPEQAERVGVVLTHATTAAWVAGYKTYLEAHDIQEPTINVGGEAYRWKMVSPKEFLTPGGPMVLGRNLYQTDSGGKCYVPLDVAWGMVGQFATVEVREAVLFAAAQLTPREVEALLGKCAPFHPSSSAIHAMVQEMGQWLEEHPQLPDEIRGEEEAPEGARVLVASLDGVNVLLAESGAKTFKTQFERELADAETRLDRRVKKLLLCDGARSLWNYAEGNPLYNDYEKLVDFYHATEHLSKAAEALFGKGSPKGRRWYEKWRRRLQWKRHAVTGLLRSMDYYRPQQESSESRQKALATEQTFFENNRDRMDYPRFRARGWPIGSGPVEAAAKTLVKARMCRSGMRWSRSGGQYVLSLRTYLKSDRWDAMWQRYKALSQTAA